jgi:hypothetical protein
MNRTIVKIKPRIVNSAVLRVNFDNSMYLCGYLFLQKEMSKYRKCPINPAYILEYFDLLRFTG